MAGTLKRPQKGKTFRLHVDLPGEVVVKIDEKIKDLLKHSEVPGEVVTRSDVVRRAIWEFVK